MIISVNQVSWLTDLQFKSFNHQMRHTLSVSKYNELKFPNCKYRETLFPKVFQKLQEELVPFSYECMFTYQKLWWLNLMTLMSVLIFLHLQNHTLRKIHQAL